jgi:hypothetical protein
MARHKPSVGPFALNYTRVHMTGIDSHTIEEIIKSFEETRCWCGYPLSESDGQILRAFRPNSLAGSRKSVVQSVIAKRSQRLRSKHEVIKSGKWSQAGRLIACRPDLNLSEGAMLVATAGYFDYEELPPYDTWVGFVFEPNFMSFLISWVPDAYIHVVAEGLAVSSTECAIWLDDLKPISQHAQLVQDALRHW